MKQVVKMGTPLNYNERRVIFNSYFEFQESFLNIWYNLNDSCVNEKLHWKESINDLIDEAIYFVDSYWVKRDTSVDAVADYKYFKANILFETAEIVSGDETEAMISETLKTYQDASDFAKKNLNPAHSVSVRLWTELGL